MLKQDVISTIDSLPENVSMEEIMYQLYIMDKHKKALGDIESGNVYSTNELRESLLEKNV